MYEKVDTNLDFAGREQKILEFWEKNEIFKKSIEIREGCPDFTFYDGPPTANGKPHIGHVITRTVKDAIPRYRTMKGYKVLRKAGWDTHGLPVELEVERALGISGKPDIEKYGVEPFIEECKKSVWKYKTEWEEMSARVGYWADMEKPYVTYENYYIESVWWALKRIWDKNLMYKGHKVVPYCPRCGTSLSSHEVAQGYKDVKETSVFVKFKLKNKDNEFFLAWTTTPWTLPSNVALVVNADEKYVYAKQAGEIYILAESLAEAVLGAGYETVKTVRGIELERVAYEPLFDFAVDNDKEGFYVACDPYVTLNEGTGIVHTAPAFGEDDARVGRIYDLPFVQLVNEQGNFVESVTHWAGMFVKDADPLIVKHLGESGKLFKAAAFEHSYPFCWRCDTPLLYYARDTWFVKMTELRNNLVGNNNAVNWLPENVKTGRFGNFLENVVDWGLSRERYWGTPLPIWECGCGHRHMIGSVRELMEMGVDVPENIELHKPYIDGVFLKCPDCGGKMKRVPEVIDCWFDSGSMPFAQWHYPFENKELFDNQFPADFISEAIDQTRGWFYTLMAISTALFDAPPFKNVIVLGHVQDKNGQKMSKHIGNVVDWRIIQKLGADAVRWYFLVSSAPWLPNRFSEEAVVDSSRRFMGTLWNTYAFFVLYANIDNFNPLGHTLDHGGLCEMDKWILSKLNTLVGNIDGFMSEYKLTESTRALDGFVDELSNWYVRRSRERFWAKGMERDKIDAYMTLHTVLVTVAKLSAPFVPFLSEEIYRNLVAGIDASAPESVHLTDFPVYVENLSDPELEKYMDATLGIVVLGRAARNNAAIKNRQPIARMYVKAGEDLPGTFADIISDELNVKKIIFTQDVAEFTTFSFKPQLKTLGPKYGKLVPRIGAYLANEDGSELMKRLNGGGICFRLDETDIELSEGDVLIEEAQRAGFMAESGRGITVVIDTNLTDGLIEEGFVRELVSKLQTMRKEAGFEVLDRIEVSFSGNERIAGIIERNGDEIATDVLADKISGGDGGEYSKEWMINGEKVTLGVKKVVS